METHKINSLVKVDRAAQVPALKLSKTEFLQTFSPVKCLKQFKSDIIPLDCSRHTDLPTLTDIRNHYGDEYLTGYIKLWIINCFEYYGTKPPDGDRLEEAVMFCVENRNYLNISDVNLIFGDIKRNYMDITLQRIVRAFADYADERAAAFYDKKLREDDIVKKHGYIPKPIEDIVNKTAELLIERHLLKAQKDAELELIKLNHDYRLSESIKYYKTKAHENTANTQRNDNDN